MNTENLINKGLNRTNAETNELKRQMKRITKTLTKGSWILLNLARVENLGAVREEGTDRFSISTFSRDDKGAKKVRIFTNSDLLPLIRCGCVNVEGHGKVGIISCTMIGSVAHLHR